MPKFALIVDGATTPIYVVGSMTWGGQQSVVVYEAPGSDSGTVLLTGRTTRKRTMTGKLLRVGTLSLSELQTYFETVRDSGKVVTLVSPLSDGGTDQYVISDFNGSILEGIESYLPFTMELTEYRQANIKRSRVNLIAFEPAQRVRELIRQRGVTPS
jgi:hypothetical protein